MSDLISRSELIKLINDKYIGLNDAEDLYHGGKFDCFNEIKLMIKNQPTAYSVGKVVEELEKELEAGNIAIDYGEFRLFEIVKQSGVYKDCNNCANYTEPDEVDNGCYLCCKGYENNYEPKSDSGGVRKDVE